MGIKENVKQETNIATLIGKRIKECREERGLTQEELGLRLGYNKSTIQRYESGQMRQIKLPVIHAIAVALEVNPSYIAAKSDDKSVDHRDARMRRQAQLAQVRHQYVKQRNAAEQILALAPNERDKENFSPEQRSAFQSIIEYVRTFQDPKDREQESFKLSTTEVKLLDTFRLLPYEKQIALIAYAQFLLQSSDTKPEE